MARSWDGGPHPNEADVRESSSMLPCLDGGECQGPEKRSARRIGRQRAATRMRPLLLVQQRWLAQIDSFFFARQRALQAPPMDLDAKPCLDLLETLRGCPLWPCGLEIDHEGDNLGRDLVPILGTALARQQARQPGLLKRPQGLVEGWPRDAEIDRDFADCDAVDAMPPHHLVAHLNQILCIEEGIAGERGVVNGLGMRIECAISRQRLAFGISFRCPCHARSSTRFDVNINTPLYMARQPCDCRLSRSLCRCIYRINHQLMRWSAAPFSLQLRRNIIYGSPQARAASRSKIRHSSSRSTVRNAARPAAIRRNSSAGSISVQAEAIQRSRPLSSE